MKQILESVVKSILKKETLPWWITMLIGMLADAILKYTTDGTLRVPHEVFGIAGGGLITHLRYLKFKTADLANDQKANPLPLSAYPASDNRYAWLRWLDGKTPFASGTIATGLAIVAISLYSLVRVYLFHGTPLLQLGSPVMLVLQFLGVSLLFNAKTAIGTGEAGEVPPNE